MSITVVDAEKAMGLAERAIKNHCGENWGESLYTRITGGAYKNLALCMVMGGIMAANKTSLSSVQETLRLAEEFLGRRHGKKWRKGFYNFVTGGIYSNLSLCLVTYGMLSAGNKEK